MSSWPPVITRSQVLGSIRAVKTESVQENQNSSLSICEQQEQDTDLSDFPFRFINIKTTDNCITTFTGFYYKLSGTCMFLVNKWRIISICCFIIKFFWVILHFIFQVNFIDVCWQTCIWKSYLYFKNDLLTAFALYERSVFQLKCIYKCMSFPKCRALIV